MHKSHVEHKRNKFALEGQNNSAGFSKIRFNLGEREKTKIRNKLLILSIWQH